MCDYVWSVLEENTSLISKLSEIKYYMYAKIPERSILAVKIINTSGPFTKNVIVLWGFPLSFSALWNFLCIKNVKTVKSKAHAKHRYPLLQKTQFPNCKISLICSLRGPSATFLHHYVMDLHNVQLVASLSHPLMKNGQ